MIVSKEIRLSSESLCRIVPNGESGLIGGLDERIFLTFKHSMAWRSPRRDLTDAQFICTYVQMLFRREIKARSAAEGRRIQILEGALRVVAAGGPDAITFRKVAADANVPLGLLTYYFDSREDLLREAFRLYLSEAMAFMSGIEEEKPSLTAESVIDMVLEITRREFSDDPAMVRIEYELILYAARDSALAREFNAYERWMETKLAASLETLGAPRPIDAARMIIDVVRGFEIERLTHAGADLKNLERRLRLVIEALISERPSNRPSARNYPRRARESKRIRRFAR
jgi:TetR/AcrR family transcriptional regulator, regulator of biofilm formation and stress response